MGIYDGRIYIVSQSKVFKLYRNAPCREKVALTVEKNEAALTILAFQSFQCFLLEKGRNIQSPQFAPFRI